MKVLFLDIDGVLNHRNSPVVNGVFTIDESLVPLLKKIIDNTGAQIVLSSTWRLLVHNRMKVESVLDKFGMRFVCFTISMKGHRSLEILEWLSRNRQVTKFAILDDDRDAGTNGLEEYFFKTSWDSGLTEDIADRVIKHLQ
jgi:hypothetical protein